VTWDEDRPICGDGPRRISRTQLTSTPRGRDFGSFQSLGGSDSFSGQAQRVNAAILYALAAGAANVAGGLVITTASPRGRNTQRLLIAFGAGFMLAVAMLAMLPHALEGGVNAAVGVLVGYLLVHLTQHVLTPHFHFGEETHHVDEHVGISALLGLLLHTFFDGVAIASGFAVGSAVGMLVFVAILLHKIPEGVTVASVMMASGNSRRGALLGVVALGVSTVVGVFLTDVIAPLQTYGLAVSAGVTLYVAASNLIPEVQKERSWSAALSVFFGVALFYAAWLMLGGEA
jgi:ZIP family zinc transporter/zinc and cadmium transporter